MDSKYTIFAKNKPLPSTSSPFGTNLKRKFAYSSSSSSTQPTAKKLHSASNGLQKNAQFKHSFTKTDSSSPMNKNHQDIQMQRKQLPVFAVQER